MLFIFITLAAINNSIVERVGDCHVICNDDEVKSSCIIDKDYNFLKKSDLNLGLKNTCIYCKSLVQGTTYLTEGPDSTFFYDHFMDIFLRKLDGIEYYGEVDEDAKQWNEYKKKFIDETLISEEILKEYKKYFDNEGLIYNKYLMGCKDIISAINDLRLKGCFGSHNAFKKTTFNNKDNYLYELCLMTVYDRLNKEKQFISYYMIRKGNQYIGEYIKNYGYRIFFEDHWNRLLEKFNQLYGYRQRIVKLVGESTRNCNSN